MRSIKYKIGDLVLCLERNELGVLTELKERDEGWHGTADFTVQLQCGDVVSYVNHYTRVTIKKVNDA